MFLNTIKKIEIGLLLVNVKSPNVNDIILITLFIKNTLKVKTLFTYHNKKKDDEIRSTITSEGNE